MEIKIDSDDFRSSHRYCSIKKAVFKILQFPQKNICASFFSIKLHAFKRDSNTGVFLWNLRLQHRCFPMKFAKLLRTSANDCLFCEYSLNQISFNSFLPQRTYWNCFRLFLSHRPWQYSFSTLLFTIPVFTIPSTASGCINLGNWLLCSHI